MKKLAKLTALFMGICFVLAFSACSHSGKEYDWKNPDGGSGSTKPNEVLALTNEWNGTYVFYDDMTFTYKESGSEEVTLKGTYTGDPSKDGELKLSVTSGNWGDGWKAPDNDYGIYFVIEGDSFTGYDWWMEDGKEVKDEENPKTFTKVEEEEPETSGDTGGTGSGDGGSSGNTEPEGGTTPENPEDTEGGSGGDDTSNTPEEEYVDVSAYVGTWICYDSYDSSTKTGAWGHRITIEEDSSFSLYHLDSDGTSPYYSGDDNSSKGHVTSVENDTLTLQVEEWYYNESNIGEGTWTTADGNAIYYMTVSGNTATVKVSWDGGSSSSDTDWNFTKKE